MRWVLFIGVLLMCAASVSAIEIDNYTATYNLVDDKAVVEVDIILNDKTTENITIELPEDYTALSLYLDDEQTDPLVENGIMQLQLANNTEISFNYVTQDVIDKTNFLMNLKLDYDIGDLEITLVLPEGAMLKKPIKKRQGGSIYPKPTETSTDGRSLVFVWKQQDLKQGDEMAIFTQIEPKQTNNWLILLIAIIAGFAIGAYIYTKKPTKTAQKKSVEKHLKEDEEQIVTILERKEGDCEQGTLRVITGFSKAHLSRLLKELEERKVIYKEKRGKKNVVFLK